MRIVAGSIVVFAAALLGSASILSLSFGTRKLDPAAYACLVAVLRGVVGFGVMFTEPRDADKPPSP